MQKISESPDIITAIKWAVEELEKYNNPSSRKEVELILSHLLQCRFIDLYLKKDKSMQPDVFNRFKTIIQKRGQGVPLQYLTGFTHFYGLKLQVRPGVFIPRPETEVLVEKVIDLVKLKIENSARILELCSGSGNISVALTKNLPCCTIMSSDINPEALVLAKDNARMHNVEDRIEFILSDLFSTLSQPKNLKDRFDLIIVNPPYVACREFSFLPTEVHYEPKNALDGGMDGLVFYKKVILGCKPYLKAGGYAAFEFGNGQQQDIEEIIRKSLLFEDPIFYPDLNGIFRFVIARRACG